MLVITEHRPEQPQLFVEQARVLLRVLTSATGCLDGALARSPDQPGVFLLTTRWADAGSLRRGFGGFDAKVAAAPVMACSVDRVSVFEEVQIAHGGAVVEAVSDRDAAADSAVLEQ